MRIEKAIQTAENCRYCLMCRHVAPVGLVTHKETLTPHGWGLLIASEKRGLVNWNPGTVDVIYSASDTGNSRAHCVTDQPLPEAIAAVRAEIVAQNLAPAVVYELGETLERYGTPFAEQTQPAADVQGDLALYVGDEAQYLWPQALEGALSLLKALGVEPALIGVGRSNGFLASSLGLPEVARSLAKRTLAELEATGAKRLFTLSPGDYFTFRQLYEERLGIAWPEEVELVEVTVFLYARLVAGELKFGRSTERAPYAYVDPTHAVRVPDRHDAPRALLEAVMPRSAQELFWCKERAHPVGSTALQFTKPDLAEMLTRARLEDARQVGTKLLVCEDAGTLTHLNRYAPEFGLRVQGLYELLAEQLL